MSRKVNFLLLSFLASPVLLVSLFYLEAELYNSNKSYSLSRDLVLIPFGFTPAQNNYFVFFERYRSSVFRMHQSAALMNFSKLTSEDELSESSKYIQDQRNRYKKFEFQGGRHISNNLIIAKYYAADKDPIAVFSGLTYFLLIERNKDDHLNLIYEDVQKIID
jgi:hypothetical protein